MEYSTRKTYLFFMYYTPRSLNNNIIHVAAYLPMKKNFYIHPVETVVKILYPTLRAGLTALCTPGSKIDNVPPTYYPAMYIYYPALGRAPRAHWSIRHCPPSKFISQAQTLYPIGREINLASVCRDRNTNIILGTYLVIQRVVEVMIQK